jgi:hypothetical protein
MGPGCVVFLWAIVLAPVGMVLGFLFSYVYLPLREWFVGPPVEVRKPGCGRRTGIGCLFTILFVPAVCGFLIFLSFKDENNYWAYEGAFDFWRMPLEEPYELVMIDTLDHAGIGKWKENSFIIHGITEYEKRGPLLAGYYSDHFHPETKGWFLFDCRTGNLERFPTETQFSAACAEQGFTNPVRMRTIQENWDLYWSNPNRRRR